jgi:type III secretory pathway component EscU
VNQANFLFAMIIVLVTTKEKSLDWMLLFRLMEMSKKLEEFLTIMWQSLNKPYLTAISRMSNITITLILIITGFIWNLYLKTDCTIFFLEINGNDVRRSAIFI